MPEVLIVAATHFEVEPLFRKLNLSFSGRNGLFRAKNNTGISILITGAGMVNTAYYMGKYATGHYNYIINAGIGGAIDKNLKIGEVVNVICDTISEMGAEDRNDFIKYTDLGLSGTNTFRNKNSIDVPPLQNLKKVSAITVNTVHGNEDSIKKVKQLYKAEIESMEGAAFFMACNDLSAKWLQIRAISNYVEKRDKSKWDIPLAIKNLNEVISDITGMLLK